MDLPTNLLETWLETNQEYYVLAKENTYSEYAHTKRGNDSIVLVVRPYGTLPAERDLYKLTLSDIRKLLDTPLDGNIFLSEDYAPFQTGQRLRDFYKGFALPDGLDHREFITKAWALESDELYEYGELADSLVNRAEDKGTDLAAPDLEKL